MRIREIQFNDNLQIETVIKSIFIELQLPLTGTVYEDKETTQMFESYQEQNAVYFIIEEEGQVKGGAGIKALSSEDSSICELQKMYIASEIRGKGYGKLLLEHCLKAAKSMGYSQCYLETLPELQAAQKLYKQYGFEYINTSMGNTGHNSCDVRMLKLL